MVENANESPLTAQHLREQLEADNATWRPAEGLPPDAVIEPFTRGASDVGVIGLEQLRHLRGLFETDVRRIIAEQPPTNRFLIQHGIDLGALPDDSLQWFDKPVAGPFDEQPLP